MESPAYLREFERLVGIMDELREKCPWDKKQTFESLRHLTIEETYELSEAILEKDPSDIKKELGDLLLHIVFYARLGKEEGSFTLEQVIQGLCEKLIHRHPHIYGDTVVQNEDDVKRNWEKLKLKEKDAKTSVLSGVPNSLPALIKSMRIQEKARGAGFDWEHGDQVKDKVIEEFHELTEEIKGGAGNQQRINEEFGDLLFSLINYGRFIHVNPEEALEYCNKRFIKRFQYMEKRVSEMNKQLHDIKLAEMEEIWQEAKTKEIKD